MKSQPIFHQLKENLNGLSKLELSHFVGHSFSVRVVYICKLVFFCFKHSLLIPFMLLNYLSFCPVRVMNVIQFYLGSWSLFGYVWPASCYVILTKERCNTAYIWMIKFFSFLYKIRRI